MSGSPIHYSHQRYGSQNQGSTVALEAPLADDLAYASLQLQKKVAGEPKVVVKIGISKVNPGNKRIYQGLRNMLRQIKAGHTDGLPSRGDIEVAIDKVRPDLYCRATGRDRAKANMKEVQAELVQVEVSGAGTTYTLNAGGQEIYLCALHGKRWAYMTKAQPLPNKSGRTWDLF
jgi:hypothetical protein